MLITWNRLKYCLLFLLVTLVILNQVHSAVLVTDKQWPKGTQLNVVFLDGSPQLHQLVTKFAPQWLENTSLSFRFFSDLKLAPNESHIRISFVLHNGSRLGNHKDYRSKNATMNLFDLASDQINEESSKRLILHEFGHALGLEHEYRSLYWPYGKEPIKKILADCYPQMELIGYSPKSAVDHCHSTNSALSREQALFTAFDERSIMNYPMTFTLPDGSTKNISANTSLSILDRHAIQQWYSL